MTGVRETHDPGRPRPAARRAAMLLVLGSWCAPLAGCSFLESEFLPLDRLPPGLAQPPDDAPAAAAARP